MFGMVVEEWWCVWRVQSGLKGLEAIEMYVCNPERTKLDFKA
jgi:hypothetical protein